MYEEKNFDEIIDNMLDRVLEKYPDIDTREGSVIYNALAPAAIEMQDLYIALDTVLNESFADTQSREFLIRRCAERGIVPIASRSAVRMGTLTGEYSVSDVIGKEFTIGKLNYVCECCERIYFKLECVNKNDGIITNSEALKPLGNISNLQKTKLITIKLGEEEGTANKETETMYLVELIGNFNDESFDEEVYKGFSLGELSFIVIGKLSNEEFDNNALEDKKDMYRFKCTTSGKMGNYDIGDLLPVEYIEGLETAKITGIITAGRDEEETEHLRQRYFENVNTFAFGGNIADYKAKVFSLSNSESEYKNDEIIKNGGIGYVKVVPAWNKGGTVKIIILDSDYNAPTNGKVTDEDYLTGNSLVVAVQNAIDPIKYTGQGVGIAPIGHKVTVVSAKKSLINIISSIKYIDENKENKETVKRAIEEYFILRIKEWNTDENLVITIGDIYTCIIAVPCVERVEEVDKMTLNNSSKVEINIENIPVLGGFDDGSTN